MASIRAVSSNSSTTGTAVSVARPTGTTTGDVVIVFVHANGQTTIVDNNGSTAFTEDLNDYKPNTTYGHTVSVFSRRIQAGDPSTYNFTIGASGRWSVIAVTIQDPNASTIYDVSPTTANAESDGNTFNAPSITTLTDGAIHIAMACLDDATTTVTGYPSGYSNTIAENDQPMGVASKVITTAGSTGAQTFTFSASSARIGVSLAIKSLITTQQTIAGKARIEKSVTQTISGKSSIRETTIRTITGKSRITEVVPRTITGVSRITKTVPQTITGKSSIQETTGRTISGKARITETTSQTITGKSRITETTSQTVTGKSRITKTVTQDIQGKSRIEGTTQQTISGKSRITLVSTYTIQGKSRITETVLQTVTGIASIQGTTTHDITGKAAIAAGFTVTQKPITGKACISSTHSAVYDFIIVDSSYVAKRITGNLYTKVSKI